MHLHPIFFLAYNRTMLKKFQKKYFVVVVLCILCFCIGYLIPDMSGTIAISDEQDKFNTIVDILQHDWYYATSQDDIDKTLYEKAILGMVDFEEDPHTNYLDYDNAQLFSSELQGSTVGLGVNYYMDENNNMVVKEVYIHSPAYKADFHPGDVITKVGDLDMTSATMETLSKELADHEGREIQTTLIRDGKTMTVNVMPGSFDNTVAYQIYGDYAKIIVNSFSEKTGADFNDALALIKKAKVKKIILDLRDNTGGYLSAVVAMASGLLPDDTVVFQEEFRDGTVTKQKTISGYTQYTFDSIVILQNENTASASEVLIGALKEHLGDDVITIGQTTYGKGTEQTQKAFNDGTSMKYTIAKWLTPSGKSINGKGFKPDIKVKKDAIHSVATIEFKEDDVIQADHVDSKAKTLQVFLSYLGYDVDREDEYFSPTSSEALKQFQSDNGLEATGNCEYSTWEKLQNQVILKLNKEGIQADQELQIAFEKVQ